MKMSGDKSVYCVRLHAAPYGCDEAMKPTTREKTIVGKLTSSLLLPSSKPCDGIGIVAKVNPKVLEQDLKAQMIVMIEGAAMMTQGWSKMHGALILLDATQCEINRVHVPDFQAYLEKRGLRNMCVAGSDIKQRVFNFADGYYEKYHLERARAMKEFKRAKVFGGDSNEQA